MADICVIYASEDNAIVYTLVSLLRSHWDVWWGGDILQGDWEKADKAEIRNAKAVVPVLSRHTEVKDIFRDELDFAKKHNRLIFPFFIDQTDAPLGFGRLNRTEAIGWKGAANDPGYQQLVKKISAKVVVTVRGEENPKRMSKLELCGKTLDLPCFVFSVSSHETQVRPEDGVKLLEELQSAASLISAYDAWKKRNDRAFRSCVKRLHQSNCVLFLDSGNYEASRKGDHYSKTNVEGWHKEKFRQMATDLSPDIAFAFDRPNPKGEIDEVTKRIITAFRADERAIVPRNFPLCPIVHLPHKNNRTLAECAPRIVANVASALDPIMVAIPERELGDGLLERVRTVRDIRKELNGLGKYYPLHLLGTGNPITMVALAVAGADAFDGLEWCRTVADYANGSLFHFQHFDCFRERYTTRLRSEIVRKIVEDREATYAARVASYNFDFFVELTRDMRSMIHSGQEELLLKMYVPNIHTTLFKELTK